MEKPTNSLNRRSLKLYNLILPIILWEIWHVLLALLVVSAIEAIVLSLGFRIKRFDFFRASFSMNLGTTLFGYLVQGIARFVFLMFGINLLPPDSPVIEGMTGNMGLGYGFPIFQFQINFATSCLLAFLLSTGLEYLILQKMLGEKVRKKRIFWIVFLANLLTYSLIFAWLLFNFFQFYLQNLPSSPS